MDDGESFDGDCESDDCGENDCDNEIELSEHVDEVIDDRDQPIELSLEWFITWLELLSHDVANIGACDICGSNFGIQEVSKSLRPAKTPLTRGIGEEVSGDNVRMLRPWESNWLDAELMSGGE